MPSPIAPPARALALAAALVAPLVAPGCREAGPATPAAIAGVAGGAVTGRVGDAVPVTVRVTTADGRPLAGQLVAFSTVGGGSVAPPTVATDAAGHATTTWTLGPTLGLQTLNAAVASVTPLTLGANVAAGRPASIAVRAGDDQRAPAGTPVGERPAVVVRDAGGNPVAAASVAFAVETGGGTVADAVATTDAAGVATAGAWTLGRVAGGNTLVARVVVEGGAAPLTAAFTAVATAGPPALLAAVRGATVRGTVGAAVPADALPAVRVADAYGNPVAGAVVAFAVEGDGATVDGAVQTAGPDGVATLGALVLGRVAGEATVTATTPGATAVRFAVTAAPDAPAAVEVASGNEQAGRAATPLPAPLGARVVDRYGNGVSGVAVTFVATSGGATVAPGTQTTDARGLAATTVTLGATPGRNTIEARVAGAPPAVFAATGLAGAAATVSRAGAAAVTVAAFQRSAPLAVVVRDAAGYPVRGVEVRFAVTPTTLGTLSATTAATDADGRAAVTLLSSGAAGTATVTATVSGLAPVAFAVDVAASAPAQVRAVQGNGQTTPFGSPVPIVPTIEVVDGAGHPVAGVPVVFGVLGGSSFVVNERSTTDARGRADAGAWVLRVLGENVLSASVAAPGIANNPVRFVATALPQSGALRIAPAAGDNQADARGATLPVAAAVVVRDAAGAPVAGVTVQFAPSADGAVGATSVQTDAGGIARTSWRLSGAAGVNTLRASVGGAVYVFNALGI